jgi:hypothetical protein
VTLSYTYDGGAVTHVAAPSALEITHRADGEASFGGVPFEDPTGTLAIVGHKLFTVEDDECAQPRLFTGFTTERGIGRDEDRGMFVGGLPRLVDVTLVDMNAALGFRQITGSDGNRPAETWAARLTWILGSAYLSEFISSDETWIVTNTTSIEAADYRSAYAKAVLDDLVDRSGGAYVYFAFWDAAASEVRLFFDNDVEDIGDCTLAISNVVADIDSSVTFAPDLVAKLAREPDQQYSDVTLTYDRGAKKLHRYRPSTATAGVRRGDEISRPYTRGLATATAQAEKWLDKHAVETDRITCTIQVPAASVGLIQAGQSIQARFSHLGLPYSAAGGATMRIVSCSPKPTDDTGYWYDVALELVYWPGPSVTVPSFLIAVQTSGYAQTDLSTHGWTQIWRNDDIGATSVIACGAGPPNDQENSMWYRAVVPGESATVAYFALSQLDRGGTWVWEVAGVDIDAITSVNDKIFQADGSTTAVTDTVSTDSVLFGVISWCKVNYDNGWGDGWPDAMVIDGAGTNLVNACAINDNTGIGCPWSWIGYTQGTGALTISATADANGYGAGAYNCGWNVGRGALILPILSGATFSIVQSAFGGSGVMGEPYYVVLPDPPTGSAITVPGGGSDVTIDLGPTPGATTTHTTDPTVDDDADAGYTVGSIWVNTATGDSFILTDGTDGAAVWEEITGAGVTDHGALTGLADDDHTQYVLKRYGGKEVVSTVAAAGATETLDLADGNIHDVTLTADCTFTFAGATNGVACSFTLLLRQDGTGGWTTTWPGSVVWAGGTAPTLDETASTVAVLTFFTIDGGTVWYGFPTGGGVVGGTPALTFGTTNVEGTAATAILTDATLAIFDATAPTTAASSDAAAVGSAAVAARRDHRHGMPALVGELLVADAPLDYPLGTFMTTASQTVGSTTTAYAVAFAAEGDVDGLTHSTVTDNSKIYVQQSGEYFIVASCIGDLTGGANYHLEVWLAVDGTNVADSNTIIQIPNASTETVLSVAYAIDLAAGQYVELMYRGDNTAVRMVQTAAASTPTRPASPAVILTMNLEAPAVGFVSKGISLLMNDAGDDLLYADA